MHLLSCLQSMWGVEQVAVTTFAVVHRNLKCKSAGSRLTNPLKQLKAPLIRDVFLASVWRHFARYEPSSWLKLVERDFTGRYARARTIH